MALAMAGCHSQKPSPDIPEMEYGDCTADYTTFYLDGIIDMIYAPDENAYFIEYCDPDCFDQEAVGDFITILVCKDYFFEILNDLEKPREQQVELEINAKWQIRPLELNKYTYQIHKNNGRK